MRWSLIAHLMLLGLILIAGLASLAQLNLPGSSWPFELFAHFTLQVVIGGLILAAIAAYKAPRLAALSTIILGTTAIPVLTLTSFEKPNGIVCRDGECLTVLTANVWGTPSALSNLAELASQHHAEVVSINELPRNYNEAMLRSLFPEFRTVIVASPETLKRRMGKPMALLVHSDTIDTRLSLPDDAKGRALIETSLIVEGRTISLVAFHPVIPLSPAGQRGRNALFKHAELATRDAESFIVMGDFNTTPWVPAFDLLPGNRAGDPRFTYTHDARKPLRGLPIDHIMFAGQLQLRTAKTLPAFGSDHRPVLASFAVIDKN